MRFVVCALASAALVTAASAPASVTFNKDVLPVLQKNCQSCHRPGEAAPMSFMNYDATRPWAKAIKTAVLSKKMPPWFADSHYGKFSNDRTLSHGEIDTLTAWADSGAKEGNAKDAAKAVSFVEGWQIGKPDAVIEMPVAFDVPASGTIDYQYIMIPTGFTEDKWVQAAEARPGNKELIHHIIAFIREPGNPWMKDAKPGVPFVPKRDARGGGAGFGDSLAGYAPGMVAPVLEPGQGKLVKAGSDLILQMHYTANGKAGTDRSRIGVIFAKQPPKERVVTLAASTTNFVIPPGDSNYEVDSKITLQHDTTLVSLLPHMHFRGKSFKYTAVYPTGEKEVLLDVPHYDFNWQLTYYLDKQKVLPAGTRIECVAHYDNSANNRFNPDPTKEVRFGEQTWEEMMFGFFDVAIPTDLNVMDVLRPKKPAQAKQAGAGL